MGKKIVGVFDSEQAASSAIEDLKTQGFSTDDISVVTKSRKDLELISEETGTKAPEGLASGAATGGILGGLTGLLAGIGALAIPGIGPVLAAGPIAATLTGAAVGAGAGGIVGGLIGFGIPEDEAREYDANVNEGKILVLIDADAPQAQLVYDIFRDNNALNTHYYRVAAAPGTLDAETPAGTLDTEEESGKLRLREERLDVNKDKVRTGEVEIHKEVVEEQKTVDVPVSREEVVIERKAVNDETTNEPVGRDETIRIPVSEERVEVTKHNVVTGEVEARKRTVQETEEVNDTVRREEARINRTGTPSVSGEPEEESDEEKASRYSTPSVDGESVYGNRTDKAYNRR